MPGQGKYTVYTPPSNEKNNLLAKLFPASPFSELVGKENEYRQVVTEQGNQFLTSDFVQGDPYFGAGVSRNYSLSPDLPAGAEGAWAAPGDPATTYFPDLSSPGPGKTDGVDKSTDTELKSSDIKPNYVPGGPNTGTRSPAETAKKIGSLLLGGNGTKMGSSDSSI